MKCLYSRTVTAVISGLTLTLGLVFPHANAQEKVKKPTPPTKAARTGNAGTKCANCKGDSPKKTGKRDACAVPMTLELSGLHCQGCEQNVTSKLMAVKGVEEVTVSAKDQKAVIWVCPHKNVTATQLTAAVNKAGYKVVKVLKGEPKTVKDSEAKPHG